MATVTEHRASNITNIHINIFVLKSKRMNQTKKNRIKTTNERLNFVCSKKAKWAERGRINTKWVKADSIRATWCIYVHICLYVILTNILRSRVCNRAHAQILTKQPASRPTNVEKRETLKILFTFSRHVFFRCCSLITFALKANNFDVRCRMCMVHHLEWWNWWIKCTSPTNMYKIYTCIIRWMHL